MSCRAAVRDSFTRDVNEVISILGCLLVDLHPQPIDKEREREKEESLLDGGGPHVLLQPCFVSGERGKKNKEEKRKAFHHEHF